MELTRGRALELLRGGKKGVVKWNTWRKEYPYEKLPDLSGADLSHADLSSADLTDADLFYADLNNADFSGAKLQYTNLTGASLNGANLSGVNLNGSDLSSADLTDADLSDAGLFSTILNLTRMDATDLTKCKFGFTMFGQTDLSTVKGLESIMHLAGSTIDSQTLVASGTLPDVFLKGCGVPETMIEYLPSLIGSMEPIQFYSCFISYSHQDEEFCKRLHSRLRDDGLRVWYAPEDLKQGEKLHNQIEEAIRVHDKLLLVLSENSMQSDWVEVEVRRALKRQKKEGRQILFPIRLCSYEELEDWELFNTDLKQDMAVEIREFYMPGDFENWKTTTPLKQHTKSCWRTYEQKLRRTKSNNDVGRD